MKKIKITEQIVKIFKMALTANPKGVQGIEQIRTCNSIYVAIDNSLEKNEEKIISVKEFMYLENIAFTFLKECMEATTWSGQREHVTSAEKSFIALDDAEEYNPQ